ncbi:MAG: hypothetical protein F4103_03450 [Boseongicola sp. SB0673_bin_14]|nr:hypothetical protein [Boseongicola sp. SB0673_bin_14]
MIPFVRVTTLSRLRRLRKVVRARGRISGTDTRAGRVREIAIVGLEGTSTALEIQNFAARLNNAVVDDVNAFTDEMYRELAVGVEEYLKSPESPWPMREKNSRSQFSALYDAKNRVIKVYNSATDRGYKYVHRWEFGSSPYQARIRKGVEQVLPRLRRQAALRALLRGR